MVQIKRKTFEDLIGNVGDDATDAVQGIIDDTKVAFDEILERAGDKSKGLRTTRTIAGDLGAAVLGGTMTTTGDALAGLVATLGSLDRSVNRLGDLPGQVAELSRLMATLVAAVDGMSVVAAATGSESPSASTPGN